MTAPPPELGEAWIPGSRWRLAVVTFASLAMSLVSAAAGAYGSARYQLVGWVGVVFFGLGAIVLAIRIVRPGGVQLSRDGFTARGFRGGFSRRWRDIEEFQVVTIGQSGSKYVGYRLTPAAPRNQFTGLARQVSGVDGMLPGQLALKADQLVDVMTAWHDRYAGQRR